MMTFGKYFGVEPNSKRMKLIGNKHIGIQPTACSRRSTQIGGRKNLAAGRVPKWKRVTEHGYTQKPASSKLPRTKLNIKSFNPSELPSKLISKAPHKLSHCVEQNKSLGSNH